MSVPFAPCLEQGTNLEGNIEISADDLKAVDFAACEDFKPSDIRQSSISDFGDQAFLLHNVLTESECKHLIEQGETQEFDTIRGVRDDYRSCKRITIQNQNLADILWSRIKDYMNEIVIDDDPHELHVHGPPSLMKGKWVPIGLNNIFRFCRYLPGGHFAPHFDGHYDKSNAVRSLKTFMLYLNGDFSGGSTNFVDDKQTLYKDEATGQYCAEQQNILCSIRPETGLAILFNHHRLHEGAALGDGKKYILRTDVMFQNLNQKVSAEYAEAVSLLQKAETMENAGECMKAAALYRKAFKLAPELEQSC